MFKVIDLFAGTQSFKQGLTEKFKITKWKKEKNLDGYITYLGFNTEDIHQLGPVVEYKPFDIKSVKDENNILDLSTEDSLYQITIMIDKYWKPNFIWASPVCNKVSAATTGPGGNSYFIVEGDTIRSRKPEEYHNVKHNGMNTRPEEWNRYYEESKQAFKMHENTKAIINHYKCDFVIENPANALSKYIYKDFNRSVAHYCAYGFEYKKPTAIYSSFPLELKKHSKEETHRHLKLDRITQKEYPEHWNQFFTIYENRSSVPPKLIEDIMNQYNESFLTKMYKEKRKW